jgi:hypothetical protein
MCPANGELENGDPESPVEFLCEVAHLRAILFGCEIPEHGACEFCAGGTRHSSLLKSARRIKSLEVDPETWITPDQLLPVLNNSPANPGCGGCGSLR